MSLGRYLGLAAVAMWLVVALGFALSDVAMLTDPIARQAEHLCSDDTYKRDTFGYGVDLSDRECLPRLAMRGGFDALMVGLPLVIGWALATRRARS